MSAARYIIGDTRTVIDQMPAESVDLILSSPPFLALRSYLPADHPDKHLEMGSEPTPGEFVDSLVDLVERMARVLAPHGSMAIELGDTYSGSGGARGDYAQGGMREGQQKFRQSGWHRSGAEEPNRYRSEGAAYAAPNGGPGWPEAKSLCLVAELFRVTLAYGRNPLTGRETPRWRVRNVVRWCRPNPPVGALGDKYRPATSDMVVVTKARDRYFDLDAVRTPHKADPKKYSGNGYTKGNPSGEGEDNAMPGNPAGAPPLDYWEIPTQPYAGSHYATYPAELCIRPIKSMCPLKVCTVCGQPSRRITDVQHVGEKRVGKAAASRGVSGGDSGNPDKIRFTESITTTVGWTDCGHNAWRTGIVLDPFAGSGTTLEVATGHGRDAIGIDLDERNADLALQRVGPLMLTVENWKTKPEAA